MRTPWTAAYQAPPSMEFFRQEYWSGVPLPSLKIPAELFKALKEDAIKVLHLLSANLEDPAVVTGLEKANPHPNSQER